MISDDRKNDHQKLEGIQFAVVKAVPSGKTSTEVVREQGVAPAQSLIGWLAIEPLVGYLLSRKLEVVDPKS